MKKLFLFLLALFPSLLYADPFMLKKPPSLRVIEDFSETEIEKFPESFRTYPFQRGKAMRVYSVQSDSENHYLRGYDAKEISVQTFKRFHWEANRWPYFSWRWRAEVLPEGAAEDRPSTNDSACGIYVVFGGYTGKVIKYLWSTTLPVGTVIEKKPRKFYMIVSESGKKNLGHWQTVAVNVVEDYKRLFQADPEKDPSGFGILTDGNATHTVAACDYDDFRISETKF